MRILQYNILNGCQGDPERLVRLGSWLKRQSYDIVGLNELNGWDRPPGIHKLGQDWGYPHAEIFVTQRSKYLIGVLSKHPIQVLDRVEADLHHGVLHILIRDVHYIITHLSPQDAYKREEETKFLAGITRGISAPLVLMGDLNTLSPLDREQHMADLLETLHRNSNLERKYLKEDRAINYRPMQTLLDAGLHDIGATVKDDYSVPTTMNQDQAHATRMRIDYILGNDAFMRRSPRAGVLHDDELHTLSDHYPVECTWD